MPDCTPQDPSESLPQASFDAKAYVQQASQLLKLSIPSEQLPSVIESFERVRAIAQPILDFPLPDSLEAAPQFEP